MTSLSARAIEARKKGFQSLAAKQQGSRVYQESIFKADIDLAGSISRIMSLPEVLIDPVQDLDPDSPTFGGWTFEIDLGSP